MPAKTPLDLVGEQSAAYESKDIDRFLKLWSDDASIFPSTASSPINGSSKVSKWIRSNAQVPKYTMQVVKEESGGDLAYQFIRYRGTNQNAKGQKVKFSGYLTRILRRAADGSWQIVHAMWKDDK